MPTTTTALATLGTRLGVCPACAGYGRIPSGCVDYQTGDDRGLHCEHCDGRGEAEIDVDVIEAFESDEARAA